MKFKILTTVLVIFSITAFLDTCLAQQDSQYTQYMYNTEIINPAYAGNRGVFSINTLYRTQWVGLEGAPKTLTASVNSPIGDGPVGLGIAFSQDEIGPSKESNIAVDFSYTIPVGANADLSFGLKGGFNLLDVDFSKLIYDPSDPNAESVNNQFSPVVGLGFYLTDKDKWYVGLSAPNILETDHYDDIAVSTASERIHFYAIGGYVFDISNTVKFKPAVLAKGVSGAPLAIDLSANFLFNEKLSLGAAYRLDAAVSALVGFQVSESIMIGYAYDYETTELSKYNSGSHEIFLRFELFAKVRRIITPRFF